MVNEPMPKHRSKLMVGDVVLKIGDTVIANDDGTLVPEMSNIAGITALIQQYSNKPILVMDVLRRHRPAKDLPQLGSHSSCK